MRRILLLVILFTTLFIYGCSGKTQETANTAVSVGTDPTEAEFFEQDSFNIPYWFDKGAMDRVLVRFSGYDGMATVDDAALARIKELAEKGGGKPLREAGDFLAEGRLYDASNFVYVAHRLGMVREVVWIMPIFYSVGPDETDTFKQYLASNYPEDKAEIDAIKLSDGVASGSVNGVPVRMMGLQDLKAPDEPVLLDIDASFFQTLYVNEKETGSLSFIAGMFKLLSEAGLDSDAISISASGEDGRAALRFRAFARYFARLLKEPGIIKGDPPKLWSERADAWRAEMNNPEVAIPIYKRIIENFPDDAASRYDLANLYFRLGELEACAVSLGSAAGLDAGYTAAYGQYRDSLASEGEPDVAARFYARRPEKG